MTTSIQRRLVQNALERQPLNPKPKLAHNDSLPLFTDGYRAAAAKPLVNLNRIERKPTPLDALERDPAFQALNPGVQQAVLETLSDPNLEPEGVKTLIAAVTSPGFAQLSTEQAEAFLEYAGNTIPGHGEAIREEIAEHLASDEFQNPQQIGWVRLPLAISQARELLQISSGAEAIPGSTPVGALPAAQRDITVTGPEGIGDYTFDTGTVDAERYTFEVDGREVEVIYPKPAPEGAPTPEELETMLETLPDWAAAEYARVLIEPNDSGRGASASTNGEGQVRIYPSETRSLARLQSTLVHEAAHNISNELGENSSIPVDGDLEDLPEGWQEWAEAIEADGHYVSDYAQNSATGDNDDATRRFGEDFAETVELYQQVKGTPAEAEFARLYSNRYDILVEVLG
ncbi:MAG: hypothetical protein JNK82_40320 [Myxococcaceae bacterium]|nr:hypothetical protein [Myxococcaceae bacterium]